MFISNTWPRLPSNSFFDERAYCVALNISIFLALVFAKFTKLLFNFFDLILISFSSISSCVGYSFCYLSSTSDTQTRFSTFQLFLLIVCLLGKAYRIYEKLLLDLPLFYFTFILFLVFVFVVTLQCLTYLVSTVLVC